MSHIIPNQSPAVTLVFALLLIVTLLAVAFALHERRRVDALAAAVAYQGNRVRAHGALIHALADAVTDDYGPPRRLEAKRPALHVIEGESVAGNGTGRRAELAVVSA